MAECQMLADKSESQRSKHTCRASKDLYSTRPKNAVCVTDMAELSTDARPSNQLSHDASSRSQGQA